MGWVPSGFLMDHMPLCKLMSPLMMVLGRHVLGRPRNTQREDPPHCSALQAHSKRYCRVRPVFLVLNPPKVVTRALPHVS
jgi:hypothetical protein